jgi:hypothetical protein
MPIKNPISMKPKLVLLILSLSVSSSIQTRAATLPDACGSDKVKFDISLQKNPLAPSAPDPGKGQIIFIEASKKPRAMGCMGNCNNFTRYGVDGAWVGATKDNSYFTLSVEPGEHHLCAVLGKDVDAEALTVEAGKVYYFQVSYNAEGTQYGTAGKPKLSDQEECRFFSIERGRGEIPSQSLGPQHCHRAQIGPVLRSEDAGSLRNAKGRPGSEKSMGRNSRLRVRHYRRVGVLSTAARNSLRDFHASAG